MNIDSELLKERRIAKLGNMPVNKMSGTTRDFFKKWNHRKQEILAYEKSHEFKYIKRKKKEKKFEEVRVVTFKVTKEINGKQITITL